MATVKAWKHGEAGQPAFPETFEIVKKAVLQVTDIKTNHNKYYAIELHRGDHKGKTCFRIYTHYGRTDDLETNPDAGQKECRYFDTMPDMLKNKAKNLPTELERLTGEFYTAIPHRIGRSRAAVTAAVINTLEAFEQKQSTLQLMKDMLQVNGEGGNVLFNAKIDAEYE